MIYGLVNLPWWGYILVTLLLTHITVMGVTLYLHRSQAHRAMDVHPILSHFFRFWLWLTTGMITKEWVAIHRKHHAKCETTEDPHSPVILGIKKVFFEGAELYREARTKTDDIEKYGHGCPNDWLERHIYKYNSVGITLMFLIDLALFGVVGISIWAIQMVWIPVMAAGVINGIGHYWGYRNYECPDASRNVIPIGILAGGEELHNNHHAYGSSARFSTRWWEFDIGWGYIRVLQLFRLVKVRKTIPPLYAVPNKNTIDMDTVKAFINNRLQIMVNYREEVLIPVFREERAKASDSTKKMFVKAKMWLIRDESLINNLGKRRLTRLLEQNQQLRQVYQYRQQLQAIWTRTTASQRELIDALHEWCKSAESAGIDALRLFSQKVKMYSLSITRT